MAVDVQLVKLLLEARQSGVKFNDCLTLGRQHYFASCREASGLFRRHGLDPKRFPELCSQTPPEFADALWRALGAHRLESMDASAYEGATIVHDLSLPVVSELETQFDCVCDVGTLEHVFNFPVAVRNAMRMVRVGGHLMLYTPANNFLAHGLYQFSPELFFRLLAPTNGFQIERMVAVEYSPLARRYEALDPDVHRRRWAHVNKYRLLLFVQARRTAAVSILERLPQQSDYAALWAESGNAGDQQITTAASLQPPTWKRWLVEHVPGFARFLEALRYSAWNPRCSLRDDASFRRIN